MIITKELLTQKLATLEAQYKQTLDNANALTGAVQIIKQLIQECEEVEVVSGS